MNKSIILPILFLIFSTQTMLSNNQSSLYIKKNNGSYWEIPLNIIDSSVINQNEQTIYLKNDTTISINTNEIILGQFLPPEGPQFKVFHFNNKFNSQLTTDVECILENRIWSGTVPNIGHYLVPSFQLDPGISVWLDTFQIKSKITPVNFNDTLYFTLKDSNIVVIDTISNRGISYQPKKSQVGVAIHFPLDTAKICRVDIYTENGVKIKSKETYVKALIKISSNGVYEEFIDSTYIRGRGNTTWSYKKKPYRLKLYNKGKPFDLKKGKNWVLLANALDRSLMCNAVSMKMGHIIGVKYTNNIVPVELYINDEYLGNYMFTEKVGIANNSVDIEETSGAYLLELDSYFDEDYKGKSEICSLPVQVKDPDLNDYSPDSAQLLLTRYLKDFNEFEYSIMKDSGEAFLNYMDLESLIKWTFVYDLSMNLEVNHPKSLFLYRQDTLGALFEMGPLWDFDYAYSYETDLDYFKQFEQPFSWDPVNELGSTISHSGRHFFGQMMKNEYILRHYSQFCKDFEGHLPELIDFIDSYYHYCQESFKHDGTIWPERRNLDTYIPKLKEWLPKRYYYILSRYFKSEE